MPSPHLETETGPTKCQSQCLVWREHPVKFHRLSASKCTLYDFQDPIHIILYICIYIYILPSIYRPWRAVSSDSALIFRSQPVFFPCLQYLHFIKIRISHKFTKFDCYMQFTNRLRLRQGWDTFPILLPPTSLCFFRNIPCPLPHQRLKSHRLNTLSYRAFESFLFHKLICI